MHYEQKQIPMGSGNFYWYRRYLDAGGRQKSEYIGRTLPTAVENNQAKFEADRAREVVRAELENQLLEIQKKLDTLNK